MHCLFFYIRQSILTQRLIIIGQRQYARYEQQIGQASTRCGSLTPDYRHLESNAKLIGRPIPQISSFETSKMLTFMMSLLMS